MRILIICLVILCSNVQVFALDRAEGFVIGSLMGEAYGGPFEFQPPLPLLLPAKPSTQDWLRYGDTLKLQAYTFQPSDYGHWDDRGRAGSLTDETRHKIIYNESDKSQLGLAESYIHFYQLGGRWVSWLNEYVKAAYWVKGERQLSIAYPPERLWGGMATQAGQMVFLFEAIYHIAKPEQAYLDVWAVNWIDQGWAKDTTSSLVALSALLIAGEDFYQALEKVKLIDPFDFNKVPYVQRRMSSLIDMALKISRSSNGNPHVLFEKFRQQLNAVTWWEDHVPFVISIAVMDFIGLKNPKAAIRLLNDFGYDTDSTLQIVGAWLGAINGQVIFKKDEISLVKQALWREYNYKIEDFLD